MAEQHPLGFRGFAGRGLRYVAEYEGCYLALLGWQSGALKCRPHDRWIPAKSATAPPESSANKRLLAVVGFGDSVWNVHTKYSHSIYCRVFY